MTICLLLVISRPIELDQFVFYIKNDIGGYVRRGNLSMIARRMVLPNYDEHVTEIERTSGTMTGGLMSTTVGM